MLLEGKTNRILSKMKMQYKEIIYYSFGFGFLNGLLKARKIKAKNSKYFPFIIHPKSFFRKNKESKLDINGRLVLGYFIKGAAPMPYNQGGGIFLGKNSSLTINGHVQVEPGVFIGGCTNGGHISIGDNTYISINSNIISKHYITIGKDCAISWGVNILDSDLHEIIRSNNKKVIKEGIKIGDHVLIGHSATILKGVIIGDNCIIGAKSVVTKDIASNTLVAGNPARILERDVTWK